MKKTNSILTKNSLEKRNKQLQEAYCQAEQDSERKKILEEWSSLETEEWE